MRNLFGVPGEGFFEGQTNDNFELLKAWAGTTLAFAILQSRGTILNRTFLIALLVSGVVCGLAFVLHELAHRVVARHYGAEAHFLANNGMLLVSILIAFLGVFFAAPGAVWHRGYLTKRQGGLIALAGPATNMVLAVIFLLGLIAFNNTSSPIIAALLYTGFKLNAWIGLFNMIPAGPFDGAKVLSWNVVVFGITVAIGIVLAFLVSDRVIGTLIGLFG
ncbi:MAG TPA: peptidase M50 [Roseiflexaceae bacterium]|nr:peptidase M50 [Roseiflexaceae bacterium]